MIERTNDRTHIAWDIETTGFGWRDEITVAGFWFPTSHAVLLLNTAHQTPHVERYEERLNALGNGPSVSLQLCDDEAALLDAMHAVIFERFEMNYNRLVAFNADSWQGGFDLPFVRTRCLQQDHAWVFDGVEFADLWEPVKKRFNTTCTTFGTTSDVSSLSASHSILLEETAKGTALPDLADDHPYYQVDPYDPFSDSGSAVHCYAQADYLPVLQHNLADVHRTWELGEAVRQYVPGRDITTKKL